MSLSATDFEMLARSWITPELATAAGIWRVTSMEGGAVLGRNGNADYSGLVCPYTWPGTPSPREYRLRLDHPEMEVQPDGSVKTRRKYLAPFGRGNLVYFAPNISADALSDTSIPIIITEGERRFWLCRDYRSTEHKSCLSDSRACGTGAELLVVRLARMATGAQ